MNEYEMMYKEEMIAMIKDMLDNADFDKVYYFYWFIGLKLGILKAEEVKQYEHNN